MSGGRTSLRTLLVWLIWASFAHSQGLPRVFHETVSVTVDAEAAKTLLTIEDRFREERWADALPDLIALAETRGRSLILWERGNTTAQYVTVTVAVDRLLATLPPEGLRLYRERIDPRAEPLWQRWQSAHDVQALQSLADHWFYSSRGDDACWELGQAAWWRGDLSTARHWWQQLLPANTPNVPRDLRHYPDTSFTLADIAARCVLCQISLNASGTRDDIENYRQQYPQAEGRLGQQQGAWVDLLLTAWQDQIDPQADSSPQNVSTYAGSKQRTRIGPRAIDLGGELWSVPLTAAVLPRPTSQLVFPTPAPLAHYPAVVDDKVYLNDGQRILGWELFTGRPIDDLGLDDSPVIYPPLTPEPALPPRRNVVGGPLWTVTVGNGRLFARMGSVVTTPAPSELREQVSELVCIDLAEGQGRLSWKLTAVDISSQLQADDPIAPSWLWEGTPLLDGSKLYATLSRRRPQLEWCVVCLDAETGRLLWQQTAGISRTAPADHENLASHLLLTAGQNRLFLSTDWGAVFCLSQHDGQPLWVMTYQSAPPTLPHNSPRLPVTPAPPVLVGQQLFVAPGDSPYVSCLDIATGALRWQRPMIEPVEHLLGVSQGCLIGSGTSLWGLDHETGERILHIRHDEPERQGYGRGWLAGELVYWPTRESICVVEAATGRMTREQVLRTPEEYRFGGHLVGYDGVLLVAASDRLTAYGEYSRLREEASGWLSAHPQDACSLLKRGDLSDLQGDTAAARTDWLAARDIAEHRDSSQWLDAADIRLARDRFSEAAGRPIREQFALASRTVRSSRVQERYLSAEWEQARSVEHRISVLERWLNHVAREPPRSTRPLTRPLALAELAQLTSPPKSLPTADDHIVVAPVAAAHLTPPPIHSGYWRRAWQRDVLPEQSILLPRPSELPADLFLIQAPGELTAVDFATGDVRWTIPHSHLATTALRDQQRLWLIGPEEVATVALSTGDIHWKRPLPWHSELRPQLAVQDPLALIPGGLLIGQPERGFWCLDASSGDIRWELDTRPNPWSPCFAIVGRNLIGQSARTTQPIVVQLEQGRVQNLPVTVSARWLRPPVPASNGESFGVVTTERDLWFYDRRGPLRSRFPALGSHAHTDPWLVPREEHWNVVVDGQRLHTIGPRGELSESLTISGQPLLSIPPVTLLADDLWLTCAAGMLRAVNPIEHRLLWEAPLLTDADCRMVRLVESETVLVFPLQSPASTPAMVEVWQARLGQRLQTISWPNPTGRLDVATGAHAFVLTDEHRVSGYVPR